MKACDCCGAPDGHDHETDCHYAPMSDETLEAYLESLSKEHSEQEEEHDDGAAMRLTKEEISTGRCSRCFGRGYTPEARKSGRGIYLRTCRRCRGDGLD